MFDYEYWGNGTFPGAVTMALEEYMLKRAAQTKKAMVRFYSFPKDTVVLGYAQATDALKQAAGADVIRRATGGSHVQTGQNILAYSFAAPRNGQFSGIEDMRNYYATHIATAFQNLGIENVDIDNRASSVNINEKVTAAHAMIWGVESALLHGLIIIEPYDMEQLARRISLGTRIIRGKPYSEYDAIRHIPAISAILPDLVPHAPPERRREAIRQIVAEAILQEVTRGKHTKKSVTGRTINESLPLLENRYGKQRWTATHRPVFTEEEIEEIPGEQLDGPLKANLGYCMYLQVPDKDFKKMTGTE